MKKSNVLRVLGIDPGTATTGWAIVEEIKGNIKPLAFGHISTSPKQAEAERLLEIARDLQKIIKKYKPQEAAIEKVFFFKNQKTIIQIGQSRGIILLTLEKEKVKISNYTPLQVKQAVTGYGRAEKRQMQLMVKNIFALKAMPKPDDVADALAVAFCHLNSRKINHIARNT
ncbi:MAG: crossover junction endodeoxyribonuclease RuvC [Candidatus Moranbacteria bacterium]|nr:crossover junction endodeoxyribonuclease RuvC [Candidatus Moranbacteria bacterium]